MNVVLNGRDLNELIQDQERDRRRYRFENQTGSVHARRNHKDRRRESEQSNTKRGRAWRREVAYA